MRTFVLALLGLCLSVNAFALSCPAGTEAKERAVGVISPKSDVAKSGEYVEKHMLRMVATLKKENVQHALYLYKKDSATPQVIFYALSGIDDARKILQRDPLVANKLFDIKLETWIECK